MWKLCNKRKQLKKSREAFATKVAAIIVSFQLWLVGRLSRMERKLTVAQKKMILVTASLLCGAYLAYILICGWLRPVVRPLPDLAPGSGLYPGLSPPPYMDSLPLNRQPKAADSLMLTY